VINPYAQESAMSGNRKGAGGKEVWGSVQGVIRKDSLARDATGLAGTVIGEDGAEVRIKGYGGAAADLIAAAADRGDPVILRGHLLGPEGGGEAHLSVLLEGPAELNGPVSRIRRSGEGEEPYVGFWLVSEMTARDGRVYRIGTGVNVYGADAAALSGLKEGDRVRLQGRDGQNGYIATSPVTLLPSDPSEGPEP
jgi:hypothetical protein